MSAAWALAASVVALGVGPLVHRSTRGRGLAVAFLDGFVAVAILCMVLFEIVPGALELAGGWAWIGLALGIAGPSLAEGRFGTRGTHRAALWVALIGLAIHALADGVAIAAAAATGAAHGLEYAVILHRVSDGLAIWWLMSKRALGPRFAPWSVLGAVAVATCIGFLVGEWSVGALGRGGIGFFGALVAGLLTHVIGHGVGDADSPSSRRVAGVGGLIGLAAVLALSWGPDAADHGAHAGAGTVRFLGAFTDTFVRAAPAMLVAYALSALYAGYVGDRPPSRPWPAGERGAMWRGIAFGASTQPGSTEVEVVTRGLLGRGAPLAAVAATWLVGTQLGIDAILLSIRLLGVELALVRVAAALGVAVAIGAVASMWRARPPGGAVDEPAGAEVAPDARDESASSRPRTGVARMLLGLREAVDTSGPWLVLGVAVAALSSSWLDRQVFAGIPAIVQVGVFALLGASLPLRASAAIVVVAAWIAGGASPGAGLAFLLTAPTLRPAVFGALAERHGRKVAVVLGLAIVVAAVAAGGLVDLALPGAVDRPTIDPGVNGSRWFAAGSAIVVTGLFLVSFVRQGPRRYLGRLWAGRSHDHDGHSHGGAAPHEGPGKPTFSE